MAGEGKPVDSQERQRGGQPPGELRTHSISGSPDPTEHDAIGKLTSTVFSARPRARGRGTCREFFGHVFFCAPAREGCNSCTPSPTRALGRGRRITHPLQYVAWPHDETFVVQGVAIADTLRGLCRPRWLPGQDLGGRPFRHSPTRPPGWAAPSGTAWKKADHLEDVREMVRAGAVGLLIRQNQGAAKRRGGRFGGNCQLATA